MTGRSAHYWDARARLSEFTGPQYSDDAHCTIPLGLLRGLVVDIEMWREIATNDPDKWGFDPLLAMAKRMLEEVYSAKIFPSRVHIMTDNESETSVVWTIGRDTGPLFASLLRHVIEHIEKDGHKPANVMHAESGDARLVMKIVGLLPDDRVEGLRVLDDARRMVERFKR